MAYPPRQQRPPNENDIFDETGAALPEVIPNPGPHVHHHDIVHFDIDPRNVFVYDTDANHRTMPVFKIADFGIAQTPNETRSSDGGPPYTLEQMMEIWDNRQIGKPGYYLPVMWCCMTLMHPIQPPRATQDAANQNHWTYGQKIMDQNYVQLYGHDLCALVSACLMHKPIDRPSLQQLRHTLDNVLGPPVLTAQDQAWLRRWLHYPSRPNARPLANAFT
ncbi:hypothetical protein J7T55_000046 [Diaporthe amygdali]|uniref:uncharacterized protein n=1 Tax=Phomopsis amygdali TaxID=1214568 RepID=UPI0022FE7992|nr:uncharacterized protein J7T55_000046 [Diaporthe amygdali]KAJ0107784.1 hypothetical protein J7T55_000046 [Diaporthe amygdali]